MFSAIVLIAITLLAKATEEFDTFGGGVYDIYKERLSVLQDSYANSMEELMRDNSKRSLKGKSGNLYEEFKKRLDRFNEALAVPLGTKSDKRAILSSSFYEQLKKRLCDTNVLKINVDDDDNDLSENFVNRQSRGFFNYFSKKFGKDHISPKSKDKKHESSKDVKEGTPIDNYNTVLKNHINPYDAIPGSLYDRYRQRLNDWSGGTIFNNKLRSERESPNLEPIFVWQDVDKNMDKLDDYDVENFIAKCDYEKQKLKNLNVKKREIGDEISKNAFSRDSLRSKKKIETTIPYGTNQWSLYPKVFDINPQIRTLQKSDNKFLKDYAQKLNITAMELAKNILKVNSTYITEKLKAAQKDQRKNITGSADSFDLNGASLAVLQSIIRKNATDDLLRTCSIPPSVPLGSY